MSAVVKISAAEKADRRVSSVAPGRLWITWNDQIRNAGLADAFGCRLVTLEYEQWGRLPRYLGCIVATIHALCRRRYEYVFAQCPSVVCTALIGFLKTFCGYVFVIDAHNATFEYQQASWPLRVLVRYSFSKADFVVVTNEALSAEVRDLGSIPAILPDKIPAISPHPLPDRCQLGQKQTITFICSFLNDEPVEELLIGLQKLSAECKVFVTGDFRRASRYAQYQSDAIVFTGFLERHEFDGLIRHSDLLIDLTTRPDCLVCGAYEALAVGTPAILSNHPPLRKLFSKGFLFADNCPDEYFSMVKQYFQDPTRYRLDLEEFRAEFSRQWNDDLQEASQIIFGQEQRAVST